jgi:ABC-type phosphate transport system substrate-binding protein
MHIVHKLPFALAALTLAAASSLAHAEIVVIVSAKNPTDTLSPGQATDIFLANTATFPAGGQSIPIDQAEGVPLRDEFYRALAGKSPAQVKGYWSKMIFTGKGRPPKEVPNNAAVEKLVAENPNAIGYIDKSAIDASVKIVLTVH